MSSQPREKAVGPMMDSNSASIASHSWRDIVELVVVVAFCERGLSPFATIFLRYRSLSLAANCFVNNHQIPVIIYGFCTGNVRPGDVQWKVEKRQFWKGTYRGKTVQER